MDRLKSLFLNRSLNSKSDFKKATSISKQDLAEKLKNHIKIILEDVKNLTNNLQSAFEQTHVQNDENVYLNKSFNTVVDYLSIIRCLDKELKDLEKKSDDFVQKISNYKIKSLSVDNLIDSLDHDNVNFDPLAIEALVGDQLVPTPESRLAGLNFQTMDTDIPIRNLCNFDNAFATNKSNEYQEDAYCYHSSSEEEEEDEEMQQDEDINCNSRIKRVPINNDSFTFNYKIQIPKMYHNNNSSSAHFSKQIDMVWKESFDEVQYSRSSKTICMEFVGDDEFIYILKLSLMLFKHKEFTAINRIILITSTDRIVTWFGKFLGWRFSSPSDVVNLYNLKNGIVDDWKEWKRNGGVLFVDFDAYQQCQPEQSDSSGASFYNLINNHSPDLLIIDGNFSLDDDVPEDIKDVINDMYCSLKLILQASKLND